MGKSNKTVLNLLPVIDECCVRQRKVGMEENCDHKSDEDNQNDRNQARKPIFTRSESLDSGVFLTPPSSPHIHSTLALTHFTPPIMFGQQGHSLAGSFLLEQEGLSKLKLE